MSFDGTRARSRYHAFLSHSTVDKPAVEALACRLADDGFECWFDKWRMVVGKPFQEQLEEGMAQSASCVVFVGPLGMGRWEEPEMRIALDAGVNRKLRVIPVALPGVTADQLRALPQLLARYGWIEFPSLLDGKPEFQNAYYRLKCGIRGIEPGRPVGGSVENEGECPYRGLEPFQADHWKYFFGRRLLIERLLDEVGRSLEGGEESRRFLAVVGASGSGKSSLVLGGLVAQLAQGRLPGSDQWPVIVFRPGADPSKSLELALARHPVLGVRYPQVSALMTRPEDAARRLHYAVELAEGGTSPAQRVVVVADQFEEIFTLCQDVTSAALLVDNLVEAANAPGGRTFVLLTIRADFYGHCARHPALASLLTRRHLLVGTIQSDDELREVIEQPAHRVGLECEEGLVEMLVQDMRRQPNALPLLQHALRLLWERREGRRLTVAAYRAIGELSGALKQHADAFYARLPEAQVGATAGGSASPGPDRAMCRRIFKRLVQPGQGSRDTRRRARLDEFAPGEQELIRGRGGLADHRLVAISGELGEPDATVEVAHEALIEGWPLLRQWIDDDRDAIVFHHRLGEAARDWAGRGRPFDAEFLYTKTRLARAQDWLEEFAEEASPLEREFIEAGLRLQDDEGRKLEEDLRERTRAAARARMVARFAIAFAFVAILLAAGTLLFANRARRAQEKAQQETAKNERMLAADRVARAIETYQGSHDAATAAGFTNEIRDEVAGWEWPLLQGMLGPAFQPIAVHSNLHLEAVATSAGGEWVAAAVRSAGPSPNPQPVERTLAWYRMEEVGELRLEHETPHGHERVVSAMAVSPEGDVATGDAGGWIGLHSRTLPQPARTLQITGEVVRLAWFGPGRLVVLSIATNSEVDPATTKLAGSPVPGGRSKVELWDTRTRQPLAVQESQDGGLGGVLAVSSDHRWIGVAVGATVRVFTGPEELRVVRDFEVVDSIVDLAFQPGGDWLAVAVADGRTVLFELGVLPGPRTQGVQPFEAGIPVSPSLEPIELALDKTAGGGLHHIAFDRFGEFLVRASEKGQVEAFDARGLSGIRSNRSELSPQRTDGREAVMPPLVGYAPSWGGGHLGFHSAGGLGTMFLTRGLDGSLRVWALPALMPSIQTVPTGFRYGPSGEPSVLAVSPSGDIVAAWSGDGEEVGLWDAFSHSKLAMVPLDSADSSESTDEDSEEEEESDEDEEPFGSEDEVEDLEEQEHDRWMGFTPDGTELILVDRESLALKRLNVSEVLTRGDLSRRARLRNLLRKHQASGPGTEPGRGPQSVTLGSGTGEAVWRTNLVLPTLPRGAVVSPPGGRYSIAVLLDDRTLRLYPIDLGTPPSVVDLAGFYATALAFSPDARRLVIGGDGEAEEGELGSMALLELDSETLTPSRWVPIEGTQGIPLLTFAQDSESLLVLGRRQDHREVSVWRWPRQGVPRREAGRPFPLFEADPKGLLVLPGPRLKEGASSVGAERLLVHDGTDLQLWDVAAGRRVLDLLSGPTLVVGLGTSADRRVVASLNAGGELALWESAPPPSADVIRTARQAAADAHLDRATSREATLQLRRGDLDPEVSRWARRLLRGRTRPAAPDRLADDEDLRLKRSRMSELLARAGLPPETYRQAHDVALRLRNHRGEPASPRDELTLALGEFRLGQTDAALDRLRSLDRATLGGDLGFFADTYTATILARRRQTGDTRELMECLGRCARKFQSPPSTNPHGPGQPGDAREGATPVLSSRPRPLPGLRAATDSGAAVVSNEVPWTPRHAEAWRELAVELGLGLTLKADRIGAEGGPDLVGFEVNVSSLHPGVLASLTPEVLVNGTNRASLVASANSPAGRSWKGSHAWSTNVPAVGIRAELRFEGGGEQVLATATRRIWVRGSPRLHLLFAGTTRLDPDKYGGWDGELRSPAADLRDMRHALLDRTAGLYAPGAEVILTNENATGDGLVREVARLSTTTDAEGSGSGDLLVFYYSGHAARVPVTQPADGRTHETTLVAFDRQVRWSEMAALRSFPGTVLVILDTSYSGGIADEEERESARGGHTNRVHVLAACRAEQAAMEGSRNGQFTGLLLNALNGDVAMGNDDQLTLDEVYRYTIDQSRQDLKASQEPRLFSPRGAQGEPVLLAVRQARAEGVPPGSTR